MTSAVAELESYLQSMLALRPPGATGSMVYSITKLCTINVQDEPVLIEHIYTHFKNAPGTHKLGVLYVIDSIVRHWIESTRKAGRPPRSAAPDGTFAAGVDRITKLLPVLMTDIISGAPKDHEEKIKKLVDIWESCGSIPSSMLASLRDKFKLLPRVPAQLQPVNGSPEAASPQAASSASHANASAALTPSVSALESTSTFDPFLLPPTTPIPYTSVRSGGGVAGPFAASSGLGQCPVALQSQSQSQSANPLAATLPQSLAAAPAMYGNVILQPGFSQDQWAAALQFSNMNNVMGAANPAQLPGLGVISGQGALGRGQTDVQSCDDLEYEKVDSHGYRPISLSPDFHRNHNALPSRRHGQPFCHEYHGNFQSHRSKAYRRGSPPDRGRQSESPRRKGYNVFPPCPKLVEWDYSIGPGNIKILSRTLTVTGVFSEVYLRSHFSTFGVVQTCIIDGDKRRAFIKMLSHQDAVRAREGAGTYRSDQRPLRTRWGVGFGPRDCSDYETGISVIPIGRLTNADRKWLLTAKYGGTGGCPIKSGMVVEEPDIEIGAGVSSKAISRRVANGIGGHHGRSSGGFGGRGRGRGSSLKRQGFGNGR
ncbi:hypothetical protein N7509_000298 [Penicillium cosmopolitanum]|uniref:CID domain-containing protein n=1 Tax=Penicillium cosmopolitanum TaxID=1131564 RepID=A0A9X0BDX9_9EURO|nr:uncharacterized protein N7509_000298 [Penicillium cosmopolitanum]KAJ5413671.1 hypothetical protein N7509_000298 [Penicillium cosmopolitanum]